MSLIDNMPKLRSVREEHDVPLEDMYKNSHNKPVKVDFTFVKRWGLTPITMSCAFDGCRQPFIFEESFDDNDIIEVVCPVCEKVSRARYFSDGNYLWEFLKEGD